MSDHDSLLDHPWEKLRKAIDAFEGELADYEQSLVVTTEQLEAALALATREHSGLVRFKSFGEPGKVGPVAIGAWHPAPDYHWEPERGVRPDGSPE